MESIESNFAHKQGIAFSVIIITAAEPGRASTRLAIALAANTITYGVWFKCVRAKKKKGIAISLLASTTKGLLGS